MAANAIKIPDRTKIKISFPGEALPATAGVDMRNPGPVMVDTVASPSGGVQVVRATAALRKAYYGYNVMSDLRGDGQGAAAPNNSCIVVGFSGVTAQESVWISGTAWPALDSEADWSGLTQVDPADGSPPIGLGLAGNKIFFYSIFAAAAVPA